MVKSFYGIIDDAIKTNMLARDVIRTLYTELGYEGIKQFVVIAGGGLKRVMENTDIELSPEQLEELHRINKMMWEL